MAVRTARIAVGNSGTGSELFFFTCPDGHTTIVKHIQLSVPAGTNTRCVVFTRSGAHQISVIDSANLGTGTMGVAPYIVLEPGDRMGIFAAGAAVVFWVSGSVLEGVEPT